MYLYRFEVKKDIEVFPVIIAASSDEQAFQLVDEELEKYFLYDPKVDDIILHEKKRIRNGNGYVLYGEEMVVSSI